MSRIEAKNVWKIYDGNVEAVKDLNFVCEHGEFMAILGPSGCGKSSTLRMIAGLEEITKGELYFDDKVVNALSPQARNIALAFESYALYPPLSVYNNLAFPLQARGEDKQSIDAKVKRVAEMMDLTDLLDRKPGNLSGGQQQRVSLARALIRDPNLFLLDEPISHMDQRVRAVLRARIRRIHDELGATTIYVTHDQEEAVALADKVLVMNLGVVQQVGSVEELWDHPANKFVAGFLGEPSMNFLTGSLAEPDRVALKGAGSTTVFKLAGSIDAKHVGSQVTVGIRPQRIIAHPEKIDGKTISAKVEVVEPIGEVKILTAKINGEELKVVVSREAANIKAAAGETVHLEFKPEDINIFHQETEVALLS